VNGLDSPAAGATREQELRDQLDSYRVNVRVGRVERDDAYEAELCDAITAAEHADRQPQTLSAPSSRAEANAEAHPTSQATTVGKPHRTWYVAPDRRRFAVYERNCLHGACWAARCECGHELSAHDFDAAGAFRSALDALAKPAAAPYFGHRTCSTAGGES
jgi:hypothetical protein